MKTFFAFVGPLVLACSLGCAAKSLDGGSNDGGTKEGGSSPSAPAGTKQAGESCDGDNACVDGLSCLDFAVHPPGAACSVVGKQCTKACAAGADGGAICATLGPKYLCFEGCGQDFACGATP